MVKEELRFTLGQCSVAETGGDTNTGGYSHVHKANYIAKRVNIEKCILREPDTAVDNEMFIASCETR